MSSQVPGKALLLANYGTTVNRAAANLPQNTTQNLFQVTGGRVLVLGLVGEVTTVLGATATNLKLNGLVTSVGGGGTDLCADVAVASLAVGTLYGFASVASATAGVVGSAVTQNNEFYAGIGFIRAITNANNTGQMRWQLLYIPVDPGAAVVAV